MKVVYRVNVSESCGADSSGLYRVNVSESCGADSPGSSHIKGR